MFQWGDDGPPTEAGCLWLIVVLIVLAMLFTYGGCGPIH